MALRVFLGIREMQNSNFFSIHGEIIPFLSMSMLNKQSLYTIKYSKWQIRHNNTTDSMKQINLEATGVQDDLNHFRYAKSRFFSNHARHFFIKLAILSGSKITGQ